MIGAAGGLLGIVRSRRECLARWSGRHRGHVTYCAAGHDRDLPAQRCGHDHVGMARGRASRLHAHSLLVRAWHDVRR